MFIRMITESIISKAPKISENVFPPSASMAFHTTTIVNAPNSAGKNLIQKTPLPNCKISQDIQEVNGGTDSYPHARCLAWSRCKYSSRCKSYSGLMRKYWSTILTNINAKRSSYFFDIIQSVVGCYFL